MLGYIGMAYFWLESVDENPSFIYCICNGLNSTVPFDRSPFSRCRYEWRLRTMHKYLNWTSQFQWKLTFHKLNAVMVLPQSICVPMHCDCIASARFYLSLSLNPFLVLCLFLPPTLKMPSPFPFPISIRTKCSVVVFICRALFKVKYCTPMPRQSLNGLSLNWVRNHSWV